MRIYVPPGQDEIERRGRKAKHLYCWRGPCEVIEVLASASGTKVLWKFEDRPRYKKCGAF